ncbi:hypothetical protein [Paraburkholderia caffeinilytica]|uniref:hypothetical protein n=1 Tax=Paraburkholderia caffeinilytica TaxID=1761016 RepID=UPI0038BCD7DC
MSSNIEHFNSAVASLLGELYQNFPTKITLAAGDFPMPPQGSLNQDEQLYHAEMQQWFDLVNLYNHTAYFLLEEGYIRGEVRPPYTPVHECCLTSKGLAALQRMPSSLKAKNRNIGDFFVEVGKDSLKDGVKEILKSAVTSLLSGH